MHSTTRPRRNHLSNNICKHFLKGNCNYGLQCRFSHINNNMDNDGWNPTNPRYPNNFEIEQVHQRQMELQHQLQQQHIQQQQQQQQQFQEQNHQQQQQLQQELHHHQQQQQQQQQQLQQQIPSSSSSSSEAMDEDGAAGVTLTVNWMGDVQVVSGSDYDYYLPIPIYQHPQCNHRTNETGCIFGNNCSAFLVNDNSKCLAYERSKDKTCGVCFEVIVEKPVKQRFGILPNCNHVFCLECIRKWRQAKQFDNKIKRSCPECRTTSDFICPSRYWVDSKDDKDKLIAEYKTALGARHCKYFKQGFGKCPFGNKCFYKHALSNGTIVDVGLPQCQVVRKKCIGEMLQHILLWDFLDEPDHRWLDDMVSLFSDSDDSQTENIFDNTLYDF